MIRLSGILTGSALAIACLIAILGVPELRFTAPGTESPPPDLAPIESPPVASGKLLPETAPAVPADSGPPPVPEAAQVNSRPGNLSAPETLAADIALPVEPSPIEPSPIEPSHSKPSATELSPVEQSEIEQSAAGQRWYAFWSPFRSELAADGFVSQLQRTTGLDYRVVKLGPGVYEVAFAYADDSDIEAKLTQISSATGLDLSGG